jgi:hypothetical protein
MLLAEIATLDAILKAHAAQLGNDLTPYRNHTYRIANLCLAQSTGGAQQAEKIAVAAAFHDLGIWTDGTFDYLQPSASLARAYLADAGKAEWEPEITEMIFQHHKITRYRSNPEWLVEPFRRADWVDVTRGLLTLGLPRSLIRAVYAQWPSAGFHKRLVQLELAHLRKHPLNPLPVFRL